MICASRLFLLLLSKYGIGDSLDLTYESTTDIHLHTSIHNGIGIVTSFESSARNKHRMIGLYWFFIDRFHRSAILWIFLKLLLYTFPDKIAFPRLLWSDKMRIRPQFVWRTHKSFIYECNNYVKHTQAYQRLSTPQKNIHCTIMTQTSHNTCSTCIWKYVYDALRLLIWKIIQNIHVHVCWSIFL